MSIGAPPSERTPDSLLHMKRTYTLLLAPHHLASATASQLRCSRDGATFRLYERL